jgi:hypothetical protein
MGYSLVSGIGVFSCCWIMHLLVWRIHRPAGYLLWLSLLFLAIPLAILALLSLASRFGALAALDVLSPDAIGAALLHGILTCCYVCGYAGIAEYSPSAEVLLAVQEHMPDGIAPEALRVRSFTEYSLTGKRVDHLLGCGMLVRSGDHITLTKSGRFAASICRGYRVFLGVDPVGKG